MNRYTLEDINLALANNDTGLIRASIIDYDIGIQPVCKFLNRGAYFGSDNCMWFILDKYKGNVEKGDLLAPYMIAYYLDEYVEQDRGSVMELCYSYLLRDLPKFYDVTKSDRMTLARSHYLSRAMEESFSFLVNSVSFLNTDYHQEYKDKTVDRANWLIDEFFVGEEKTL